MHRRDLTKRLLGHCAWDDDERKFLADFVRFVAEQPRCFERELAMGHVTGSAWILAPEADRVLLTHHRKLDRWLQLGGHCDGDPDVLRVALSEAREESGIADIEPLDGRLFDVDVHEIPPRGNEPAHLHYDARFVLLADPTRDFVVGRESKDLAWVALDKLAGFGVDRSVLRMSEKTQARAVGKRFE